MLMLRVSEEQVDVFMSLFRGRTDIYARYWEKNGRSGYSPAYEVNWTEFNKFKKHGGSFKDFKNKKPVPLTGDIVKKHLLGQYTIGIYPILPDNISYFLAADFDGEHWLDDSKAFIVECERCGLHPFLERSKSGNGGHVWIFFENSYPCYKSRRMALELIRRALNMSDFDKEISFDRLFPNQDSLTKDGFGNLIALPLQGRSLTQGNMVFLDPETATPYQDQWDFLTHIHRHSFQELEDVYYKLFHARVDDNSLSTQTNIGVISITLNNKLILKREQLYADVVRFLREKLNFINAEYLVKRRLGKSVYQVQKYFKLIEEVGNAVLLPRGFLNHLVTFLKERQIAYELTDLRPRFTQVNFSSNIALYPEQATVVEQALLHDSGVIIAPSGSGKTIIGLEIIARRKLPALILVHRKQLLDQWVERIQTFLEIPKTQIGIYSGIKKKPEEKITVAMLQSLARLDNLIELKDTFGTIVVDECHHIPAKTFREIVSQLNSYYLYGLTATPKRKHNDEQLIYIYIGDTVAEMKEPTNLTAFIPIATEVLIRETTLIVPFKFSIDNFQLLSKIVCFDTNRNQLIVKDIIEQIGRGKKVLVLSERRDHLEVLSLYLKGLCETIVISGEDSTAKRTLKLHQILNGHYQVILSTGQFFGEGLDINNIDSLILAFPFAFEGKLIQYIGRLRGNNNHRIIIDYRDSQIFFLEKQFKQRQRYYKKLQKAR